MKYMCLSDYDDTTKRVELKVLDVKNPAHPVGFFAFTVDEAVALFGELACGIGEAGIEPHDVITCPHRREAKS